MPKVHIGQWVLIGWEDAEPDWWLIKALPQGKDRYCDMYNPMTGKVRGINLSQIQSYGGMISLPA